ncbi:MAG: hypothetical protein AAF539_03815, partial [Planctomycetota bacterium]
PTTDTKAFAAARLLESTTKRAKEERRMSVATLAALVVFGSARGCAGLAATRRVTTTTTTTRAHSRLPLAQRPVSSATARRVASKPFVVAPPQFGVESDTKVAVWRAVMLGITMCWATNFALLKFGTDALPPSDFDVAPLFVAVRFLVASLACVPFLKASDRGVYVAGARVGAWCALGYGAQVLALDAFGASASTTAFLCSLQTVVVAALVSSGRKTMAAVFVAILGVGVLCFGSESVATGGLGDVVALGQAVGFGLSYIELEDATRKFPNDAKPLAATKPPAKRTKSRRCSHRVVSSP